MAYLRALEAVCKARERAEAVVRFNEGNLGNYRPQATLWNGLD